MLGFQFSTTWLLPAAAVRPVGAVGGSVTETSALSGLVPAELTQPLVAIAAARPESEIRDLFERFLPADKRMKRLGTSIQPQTLLAMKGDADAGRVVFFKTAGIQCAVNFWMKQIEAALHDPRLTTLGRFHAVQDIVKRYTAAETSRDRYIA